MFSEISLLPETIKSAVAGFAMAYIIKERSPQNYDKPMTFIVNGSVQAKELSGFSKQRHC